MTDEKKKDSATVSLIEDPYGFRTLEIAEAQESSDAIDENLPEMNEEINIEDPGLENTLESLSRAMKQEEERHEEEVSALAEVAAKDMADRLAKEIAEDEALQAQLAKEAEETMEEEDPELRAALPQSLDQAELESCIETLLFLSDKPVSVNKLREMIGEAFPLPLFQEAITSLRDRYGKACHGIEIVEINGGLQFRTKPGRAPLARKLAKVQTQKLSSGAMESLAIIAFRQPVLKEDIDKIRGVDSSYFIRGLLDRKLIEISGRSDLPGRPMMYTTTSEFLELFGLKDLSGLPSLRELEQMIPASQTGSNEDDPRIKQMRSLVAQMKADTSTSLIYDHREDEKLLQEIRERVNSIPTSTAWIEEQKALEKAAKEAKNGHAPNLEIPAELQGMAPPPEALPGAPSDQLNS